MSDSDEEYYTVPLKDQRYYGAGIKRQRVHFVPSSTRNEPAPASSSSALSASQRYLSIVLPKAPVDDTLPPADLPVAADLSICDMCKTEYHGDQATHCSTLVHQIALPHSHPPSALDRTRKGLSILQAYGWNPDDRLGLGAQREGILHPVKAKEKRDTVGLGLDLAHHEEPMLKKKKLNPAKTEPIQRLDAGKIRKLDIESKKKDERLRNLFYANEDIDKYLGGGG
jgi:hypothetical protein